MKREIYPNTDLKKYPENVGHSHLLPRIALKPRRLD